MPELVRLSLEAAAEAAQGTKPSEPCVVEEAARTLSMCLTSANAATATAWQNVHLRQLQGSAAVLQNLAGSFPAQLSTTEGCKALLDLVQVRAAFIRECVVYLKTLMPYCV